jgi:hypothetical protein
MTARSHLRLLGLATAVWIAFWLAGLPDYYRQYSSPSMVVFEVLLLGPVWAAGYWSVRDRRRVPRMARAVALAFYFTVPLLGYDALYCGVWLGHGGRFLVTYWYLTAYYLVPWVLFPATARWLDVRDAASAARRGPTPAPLPGPRFRRGR